MNEKDAVVKDSAKEPTMVCTEDSVFRFSVILACPLVGFLACFCFLSLMSCELQYLVSDKFWFGFVVCLAAHVFVTIPFAGNPSPYFHAVFCKKTDL